MEDCLFCRIARGEIPSKKVYEDEFVIAFDDISPQAPVHVLIIPRQHAGDIQSATEAFDDIVLARLFRAATQIAKERSIAETGYRIVVNSGDDACQSVHHLHLHLLGGKRLPLAMG